MKTIFITMTSTESQADTDLISAVLPKIFIFHLLSEREKLQVSLGDKEHCLYLVF